MSNEYNYLTGKSNKKKVTGLGKIFMVNSKTHGFIHRRLFLLRIEVMGYELIKSATLLKTFLKAHLLPKYKLYILLLFHNISHS